MPRVASYFKGKVWWNTRGGGFTSNYNLNGSTASQCLTQLQTIARLEAYCHDGGTRCANIVMSLEQAPGSNPPDGIEIPHGQQATTFNMLAYPGYTAAETVPVTASDPSLGIFWKLDTSVGYQDRRLLRGIRSTWIQNNQLIFGPITPLPAGGANLAIYSNSSSETPYAALQNYFSYVRDNTQYVAKGFSPPDVFSVLPFVAGYVAPPALPGPDFQVQRISRRTIGLAWPPVAGKKRAYA
jgi:hypothetical protein